MPPDSSPTARPSSKPKTAVTAITVARPLTATTSASTICGTRVLLQAPEKLRADRIADREQEQVEERPAQQIGQFGFRQDADDDAGNQRPDHGPEADTLEVKAADDGPEQDAQEQAQGRKVVEKCREPFHGPESDPLSTRRTAAAHPRWCATSAAPAAAARATSAGCGPATPRIPACRRRARRCGR